MRWVHCGHEEGRHLRRASTVSHIVEKQPQERYGVVQRVGGSSWSSAPTKDLRRQGVRQTPPALELMVHGPGSLAWRGLNI